MYTVFLLRWIRSIWISHLVAVEKTQIYKQVTIEVLALNLNPIFVGNFYSSPYRYT